jgi:hypothetical protein
VLDNPVDILVNNISVGEVVTVDTRAYTMRGSTVPLNPSGIQDLISLKSFALTS